MTPDHVLHELQAMSIEQRLAVIEAAIADIKHDLALDRRRAKIEEMRARLPAAAEKARALYESDEELTVFSCD